MPYSIVIVGAGQLGSRYLQGLADYPGPLNIFIVDTNQTSLDQAKSLWLEVAGEDTRHVLDFSIGYGNIPAKIDLAIISTSSHVREMVIRSLLSVTDVAAWVFEKVLAQSIDSLKRIESLVNNNPKAWVNTFFRTVKWFHEIRQKCVVGPISVEVTGGNWGIACNAIHIFDFTVWWTGENITSIDTAGLKDWHPAKRPGFWEINGCLQADFSQGSSLKLISDDSTDPFLIKIKTNAEEWVIEWDNNIARRNDGFELPGKTLYQSERTLEMVKDILEKHESALPTLKFSIQLHTPFLSAMLAHWNSGKEICSDILPIT